MDIFKISQYLKDTLAATTNLPIYTKGGKLYCRDSDLSVVRAERTYNDGIELYYDNDSGFSGLRLNKNGIVFDLLTANNNTGEVIIPIELNEIKTNILSPLDFDYIQITGDMDVIDKQIKITDDESAPDRDTNLHITSNGSVSIYLEADRDNITESDVPFIVGTSDGGVSGFLITHGGSPNSLNFINGNTSANTNGDIRFYTGLLQNNASPSLPTFTSLDILFQIRNANLLCGRNLNLNNNSINNVEDIELMGATQDLTASRIVFLDSALRTVYQDYDTHTLPTTANISTYLEEPAQAFVAATPLIMSTYTTIAGNLPGMGQFTGIFTAPFTGIYHVKYYTQELAPSFAGSAYYRLFNVVSNATLDSNSFTANPLVVDGSAISGSNHSVDLVLQQNDQIQIEFQYPSNVTAKVRFSVIKLF